MAQGIIKSLIKISKLSKKQMPKGMSGSQKKGRTMGQSYNKTFNNETRQPIGGIGNTPNGNSEIDLSQIFSDITDIVKLTQLIADRDEMYRNIAIELGETDSLKAFNDVLRDPLENAAYTYTTSIEELNNYVLKAVQSKFNTSNIASSLDSVAGMKRSYDLSVPAITELIVTAGNNGWIDPSDSKSINKYLAQLITMEENKKGSLKNFSNTLSYTQPIGNAPRMTDTDYISLMGIMPDSTIKDPGKRRAMANLFQRLFVSDSQAESVEKEIISSMQKDGYNVNSKDFQGLSDYLSSIGWSLYDEDGYIQIGEGKRYANYTEAVIKLMEKIDNSDFSNDIQKKMDGDFGQIVQKTFEYLLINHPKLQSLESQLISVKENPQSTINKSEENIKTSGLDYERDRVVSAFERLNGEALGLEESFGGLQLGLKTVSWTLDRVGDSMKATKNFKDNLDNEISIQKLGLAYTAIAEKNNIDLQNVSEQQKQNLVYSSFLMVKEENEKRKNNPFYHNPLLKVGTGQGWFLDKKHTNNIIEIAQDPNFHNIMTQLEGNSWKGYREDVLEYAEQEEIKKQKLIDRAIDSGTNTSLVRNYSGIGGYLTPIEPIVPPKAVSPQAVYKELPNVNITIKDATIKGAKIEVEEETGPTRVMIKEEY